MFAKFKLPVEDIRNLKNWTEQDNKMVDTIKHESIRLGMSSRLKELIRGELNKDVIDGAKLQNYVFPTGKDGDYDVFISYSHNNKDEAIFLASWLSSNCQLKVFLDSYVWGSADGLLQNIDDIYCKQNDGKYNYRRRNYSTSHVHAMLSMAIMDIINKTECCIFIDSNESIHLRNLKKTTTAKTLSPWIYEENKMMQLLPSHGHHRSVRLFSSIAKAYITESLENLKMAHAIDYSHFLKLNADQLKSLEDKGLHGLDELYNEVSGKQLLE